MVVLILKFLTKKLKNMKKLLLLFVFTSQIVLCQGIKVLSNEEMPVSSATGYFNPVLSPTGDYLVVTSEDMKGLQKYDFSTGEFTTLTSDAGAGFDIQISADGNIIVYRQREYKNRLRYTTLKSLDLQTGRETELIKQTRDLEGVAIKEGTVLAVENGSLKTKKLSGKSLSSTPPVSSIKDGQLYMTKDNTTCLISPAGEDVGYLWNSVSPDGTRLLYYVIDHGKAYVSNIDGSNPVSLGTLRAPKWMGNNWVIGMVDYDNGEIITSSKITAVTADGKVRTDLTDNSVIATYPTASADASKILYNTADGKLYLMQIETSR